jgi:hypothetical protein
MTSTGMVLAPLIAVSVEAFLIAWAMAFWLLYPFCLASVLYTQHWLHLIHLGVIGRMLRHLPAFVYVYLMTFAVCAGAVWLVQLSLMHSLAWAIPAIVCVPAAILLYARHWGRFAWLSLNYVPSYAKKPREKSVAVEVQAAWPEGDLPALPAKAKPKGRKKKEPDPDELIDTDPYGLLDNPAAPTFEEETTTVSKPTKSVQAPVPHLMVEEEDEWATEKKPYNFSDADTADALPPDAPPEAPAKPDADKPVPLGQYFDERAKKQQEREEAAEEFKRTLPPLSKRTPSFYVALLAGVWRFLFYGNTLQIWLNLVFFMVLEMVFLYMLKATFPRG